MTSIVKSIKFKDIDGENLSIANFAESANSVFSAMVEVGLIKISDVDIPGQCGELTLTGSGAGITDVSSLPSVDGLPWPHPGILFNAYRHVDLGITIIVSAMRVGLSRVSNNSIHFEFSCMWESSGPASLATHFKTFTSDKSGQTQHISINNLHQVPEQQVRFHSSIDCFWVCGEALPLPSLSASDRYVPFIPSASLNFYIGQSIGTYVVAKSQPLNSYGPTLRLGSSTNLSTEAPEYPHDGSAINYWGAESALSPFKNIGGASLGYHKNWGKNTDLSGVRITRASAAISNDHIQYNFYFSPLSLFNDGDKTTINTAESPVEYISVYGFGSATPANPTGLTAIPSASLKYTSDFFSVLLLPWNS